MFGGINLLKKSTVEHVANCNSESKSIFTHSVKRAQDVGTKQLTH